MRLIGRNKPEEPTTKTAEFVIQLGNNKVQLPADRLPGAIGHADEEIYRRANGSEGTSDEQDKAINTFMRMRDDLHHTSATTGSGPIFPFSPDDVLSPHQRSRSEQKTDNLTPPQFPNGWDHRRASNNLPEPYDETHQPTTFCPAVPNPDIMPLRHKPTIFDSLGELPRQRTATAKEPLKRDSVGKRPRVLKHFLTDRTPSTHKSETSRSARTRPGVASSNSSAGKSGRVHDFGDDVTKINVRRPPKGIQNWFDGIISDDDEEEFEEDEEDEEDEEAQQLQQQQQQQLQLQQQQQQQQLLARVQMQRARAPVQTLEPQELPADDVPPPAYSNLVRGASTASRWSDRSYTPGDDNPPPFSHADEKAPTNRTDSVSTTGDNPRSAHSIPHSRRQNSDSRLSRSKLASESVLALSDQSGSENETDNRRRNMSSARNSIDDEHSVRLEAAARVHVQRYGMPTQVSNSRAYSSDEVTSAPRGNVPLSDHQVYPGQQHYRLDSRAGDPLDSAMVALRRLHGSGNIDSRVSTSSSNRTFEMENRTLLATDSASNVYSEASHMMVVTEEERALLDMMRRKRAAMAQMSFTEGYHHALRREQASPMRRSASADSLAQEILDQRGHPAVVTSHEIMRKKLSALQKQDVDEVLKMERFLGMQSQTEEKPFAWPRDSMMPTALPTSQPRDNSRISESYTPIHPDRDSAYQTWSPQTEPYNFEDQAKNAQYTASNTMPSSLQAPELVRRTSSNHDVVASPVFKEEPIPDVLNENRDRGRRQDITKKHAKRISRSMDTGPMLRTASPHSRSAAAFEATTTASPTNSNLSPNTTSLFSSLITRATDKHRRQAGAETPDTDVSRSTLDSKKNPLHVRARDSGYNQRGSMVSITSAGEDVLAAWADLGGGSDCLQQHQRRPPTATTQPQ